MKWLDKYLPFIISTLFITSLLLVICGNEFYYLFFSSFVILMILYKKGDIKEFFTTKKVHVLDKCIQIISILIPVILVPVRNFMKEYFNPVFFTVIAILLVVSKRNFFKNLFKKGFAQKKNEKNSNSIIEDKTKSLDRTMQYISITGCVLIMIIAGILLIFSPKNIIRIDSKIYQYFSHFITDLKIYQYFHHFIYVTLIIMVVALAICEHKKNQYLRNNSVL